MTNGFFDKDYGICKPIVRINYKRDYYKIHNVRLTVDRYIEYIKLKLSGKGGSIKHMIQILLLK